MLVCCRRPSAGSSDTNMCDYYYQAEGDRIALVGGQWSSDFEDGLFASSWSATSGLTTTDIGARLLIRDLMCFVPVCSSSYLLVSLLLSAVIGTTLPRLACGIGISIMLPLICGLPSVLDYLICSLGTWCV